MPAVNNTEQALRFLGFAARAGRTVVGVPLICAALAKGAKNKTPLLVLCADDCSANTQKRITDRTAYYGVKCYRLSIDCTALALAVGKRDAAVAAVGVCEPNLAQAIAEVLEKAQ